MPEPYRASDGSVWLTRDDYLASITERTDALDRQQAATAAALDKVLGPNSTTEGNADIMSEYTYNPGGAAEAAAKDPTFIANRDAAIMTGTDYDLATARALVAYAARNGITSGLLTNAQYDSLSKAEQNRLGFDIIREPDWADLTPVQRMDLDFDRFAAENPEAAKPYIEAAEYDAQTPDERALDAAARAAITQKRVEFIHDTALAAQRGDDLVYSLEDRVLSLDGDVGRRAVQLYASELRDAAKQADARVQSPEPTLDEAFDAVRNGSLT